jgi:hypothetical protein
MVMVPHGSSSGERHANGRIAAVGAKQQGKRDSTGTPRKDELKAKEKAMQDPGLKDYVCSYVPVLWTACLTFVVIASWGMPREGRLWLGL